MYEIIVQAEKTYLYKDWNHNFKAKRKKLHRIEFIFLASINYQ